MNLKTALRFAMILLLLSGCASATDVVTPTPEIQQTESPVTDSMISDFITAAEDEFAYYHIPGGAIAIIHDGEIIHMQGLGIRNVATGEPFTPQTQFRTGSTGKSLTSLMVAQAVDQGALDWDTRVIDILPSFETRDPELTLRITVRDLMSMSTGLVSDESWSGSTIESLLDKISTQEIGGLLHQHYSYNNEVYATAAYVALQAMGIEPTVENYADRMQTKVFDPIHMPSAILTDNISDLGDNYSLSYEHALPPPVGSPVTQRAVSMVHLGVLGPAGGFWMNIEDMSRYLIMQMEGGITADDLRIVSAENLAVTWQPGVKIAPNPPGAELYHFLPYQNAHYGMGWINTTYRDIPIRQHGGGIAGYRTIMAVFPEKNTGLLIFTNGGGYGVTDGGLMLHFAELLYGLEPQALEATHQIFADQLRLELQSVLGAYEEDWTVELREDATLWLVHSEDAHQLYIKAILGDGSTIVSSPTLDSSITFHADGNQVLLTWENGTTVKKISP